MDQTIAASLLSVILFFLFIYVVAPIIDSLLHVFGRWFGREVDSPSILTNLMLAVIASVLSAYAALAGSLMICSRASAKTVAVIFALAMMAWAGVLFFLGFKIDEVGLSVFLVLVGTVPALFVAYSAWRGGL